MLGRYPTRKRDARHRRRRLGDRRKSRQAFGSRALPAGRRSGPSARKRETFLTLRMPTGGALLRTPTAGGLFGLLRGAVDEPEELGPGPGILAERSQHLAGDHRYAAFVDAARGHALVDGVDHDANAAGLQYIVDAAGNLRGELFLHLEAAGVDVDHARELADADHLRRREVPHVRMADDRGHVVLAMRFELDLPQDDHLVVALDLLKRASQVVGRVARIA